MGEPPAAAAWIGEFDKVPVWRKGGFVFVKLVIYPTRWQWHFLRAMEDGSVVLCGQGYDVWVHELGKSSGFVIFRRRLSPLTSGVSRR